MGDDLNDDQLNTSSGTLWENIVDEGYRFSVMKGSEEIFIAMSKLSSWLTMPGVAMTLQAISS